VAGAAGGSGIVHVERAGDRKLHCSVGRHVVVTDRKVEDGGSDAGCTSGELLLVAAGSCAAGSTRRFLDEAGLPSGGLAVDVGLEPAADGERDTIVIELRLPPGCGDCTDGEIQRAALSGGVVSRLALGSTIRVVCRRADDRNEREGTTDEQ
jgi:uncharacterized OsmC-like protein